MRKTRQIGKVVAAMATSIILVSGCVKTTSTVVGHLDIYENFTSQYVDGRTVRVWTPEGYDESQKYDVIYMHDGQNLFDSSITTSQSSFKNLPSIPRSLP